MRTWPPLLAVFAIMCLAVSGAAARDIFVNNRSGDDRFTGSQRAPTPDGTDSADDLPDAHFVAPRSLLVFDHLTRGVALLHDGAESERQSLRREVMRALRGAVPEQRNHAAFAVPQPSLQRGGAGVGKAQPVDQRLVLGQAEEPRSRVAWLSRRGDRPQFQMAEPQAGQAGQGHPVLVAAGGQAEGVGESHPERLHRWCRILEGVESTQGPASRSQGAGQGQ